MLGEIGAVEPAEPLRQSVEVSAAKLPGKDRVGRKL
jgi:hypothetical protein